MIKVFSGKNANEVWAEIVDHFRERKRFLNQESRCGPTKEILHVGLTITNPRQRWVTSRFPALNPAFAIAEVVWIVTGRRDAAFLNAWNSQLPKFAGTCREYHGAYGFRIKKHFKFDQLIRAYEVLRTNPASRQVVLQIWDPRLDSPNANGRPVDKDIPCNVLSMLKVRDHRLEWMQIIRSNDLFLGVPYNFVQFTYLQEILAGWLRVELGSYNQISDSLHVYETSMNEVLSSKVVRVATNTDALIERKDVSEHFFKELSERIHRLASLNTSQVDLASIANWSRAPIAYRNMLLVMVAEAARKKKMLGMASDAIGACTNPALVQQWEGWFARTNTKANLSKAR